MSEDPATKAQERPLATVRILVIDDEPDARALVVAIMKRQGAEVAQAADATEGLAAFRRQLPDVLIVDPGLRGEAGLALIKQLRSYAAPEGGAVPAIALTGMGDREYASKALAAGFTTFMSKPIQPMRLVDAVLQLVERRAVQALSASAVCTRSGDAEDGKRA